MFKELAKRLGFLPPQGARPQADQPVEDPAPRDAGEPEAALEPLAGIEELVPAAHSSLDRALTFTAVQAFLLGFRTSEGLTPLPPRTHSA